jgi:hypothetical protein
MERRMRQATTTGHRLRVVVLGLSLAVFWTGDAFGQYSHIRDGFYSSIGIGFGSGRISCSQCAGDRAGGISGLFAIGTAIDQPLILGAELDLFYRSESNFEDTWIGTVTAFGQWYPVSNGPFFLKGGLGFSGAQVTVATLTGFESSSATGVGYMAAAGYDFRIGAYLSVTPLVGFYGGSLGDVDQATGVNTSVLQALVTVGFF